MTRCCQVTIVYNPSHPLSKQYRLVEGKLVSEPNPGAMSDGLYQVFDAPNKERLNAILNSMTAYHGLVLGAPMRAIDGGAAPDRGRLVSLKVAGILTGDARSGVVTRTSDGPDACYSWSDGPQWAGVDIDACPDGIVSLGLLAEDLGRLLPDMGCEWLLRVSGSCLLRQRGKGEFLKGFKAHGYFRVLDGRKIPAITRALKLRLEPHGYVIDTAVNTPEHWFFAGPPVLGVGLVAEGATAWPVAGSDYLDPTALLASVPPVEPVAPPVRAAREGDYTEAEREVYRRSYLPHKLEMLRAWGSIKFGDSPKGRHNELNGRVFACGPCWDIGLISTEVLWDIVVKGANANGYLAHVGERKLREEFERALQDGADTNPLPPLNGAATMTPDQAFGGPAPALPFGDGGSVPIGVAGGDVARAAAGLQAAEYVAQWVAQRLAGNQALPVWEFLETPEGMREFEGSAIKKGEKADIRSKLKQWKKAQIRQKFADAVDNIMEEMNEKYAFINDRGGKSFVMWVMDDNSVAFKSVKDFKDMESNRLVTVDGESKDYGTVWLKHGRRQTYDGIVFDPNNETGSNYYNLWHGLAIESIAGDWSKQEWHIRNILASGNSEHADFIFNCFAWKLQNPGKPLEVSVAFRGKPGVGKGVTLRGIKNIFGKHGLHATNPKHLTGDFNAHLETCCFLFADEAYANGDKKIEAIMKGLITEPTLIIEPKGVNPYEAKNRLAVFQATNHEWVAPVGAGDRRYAVFDVSDARKGDWAYFDGLYAEMANGGLNAFLHAMLARNVSGWNARSHIPDTEAKREQADMSLSAIDAWWLGILEVGELPGNNPSWEVHYKTLMNDIKETTGRAMPTKLFGKIIRGYGGEMVHTTTGNRWKFEPLHVCRQKWEAVNGPRRWPRATAWRTGKGLEPALSAVQEADEG